MRLNLGVVKVDIKSCLWKVGFLDQELVDESENPVLQIGNILSKLGFQNTTTMVDPFWKAFQRTTALFGKMI